MTGFEPGPRGIGSDHSVHCVTITAPPDSQIFIMILPSVVALCVFKKLLGLALLFDITLTFSYRRSEVRTDLNLELGRDISKQQGTCQTRRRRSKSFVRSKPLFARGRGDSADYILPNAILSTFLFSSLNVVTWRNQQLLLWQ